MEKENDLDIKDEDLKEEDFTPEELESEDVDWKAKAQELKGIAKRRATQLKKAKEALALKEEKKIETKLQDKKEDKKSDTELLDRVDKLSLQVAGVKGEKEIELFNKWKERGFGAEEIVGDDIFQAQLEKIRTDAKNEAATADVKGGGGEGKAKLESAHYINKGAPPTREDIPDNKTRRKVQREFLKAAKGGGKQFYSE